jgi:hypothetical protein
MSQFYKSLFSVPCPTCGMSISRISGCNYMTCGFCKTPFCYRCGSDFKTHQGFKCLRIAIFKVALFLTPMTYGLAKLGFFRYIKQGYNEGALIDKKTGRNGFVTAIRMIPRLILYQSYIPISIWLIEFYA